MAPVQESTSIKASQALAAMPLEHALPDGVSAVAPEIRNGNIIKDAGSHTLLTVKE
jgi:hypothetical protein